MSAVVDLAAVPGVHASIKVVRAKQEQLVIGDLVQCAGWSCPDQSGFPIAAVVDSFGSILDTFCSDCLPGGAGWWARSLAGRVSVLLPFDELAEQPIEVAS